MRLSFMTFPEWRRAHPEIEAELDSKLETGFIDCPECGGDGTTNCECLECGNVHEKDCPACGGDGEHDNLELAMQALYKEQLALDMKKAKEAGLV